MHFRLKRIFAISLLFIDSGSSFVAPESLTSATRGSPLKSSDKENWTYNPFDVNDLSPLDTLLRRGIVPMGIRLFRPEKYEAAVLTYMRKEGCDRPTAQRNMDAFFNDPNGWVVAYGRKRDLGEDFGDVNAPTGVQKRPIFSFFWATFCLWFFFSFLPTRTAELGGIQPSLPNDGFCKVPIRAQDGTLKCPTFDDYAIEALKENR
jgi:hypothetical protein